MEFQHRVHIIKLTLTKENWLKSRLLSF